MINKITKEIIISKALEAGIMISTIHGQGQGKLMPVSDEKTLIEFYKLVAEEIKGDEPMKNEKDLRRSMIAQIKIVEDMSDTICDQAAELHHKGFDANIMKLMRENTNKLVKAVHEYSAYRNCLETSNDQR